MEVAKLSNNPAGTPVPKRHRSASPTPSTERIKRPRTEQITTQSSPKIFWSNTRQALCDALPFFKSHQGGTYTTNRMVRGLLLGGFTEPRDFLGRDKLITTVGGGREQTTDGHWVRTEGTPKLASAWIAAQKEQLPIAVIIGKKHPEFGQINTSLIDADMTSINYVVLDFFFVDQVWQERVKPSRNDKAYIVTKLMLQRIDDVEQPIYLKAAPPTTSLSSPPCLENECQSCRNTSPSVFDVDSFVCLHQKCQKFFMVNNQELDPDDETLKYRQDLPFSKQVYTGDRTKIPQQFQPMPEKDTQGYGTEKALRCGLTCPDCGACSRRITWGGWDCENPSCGYSAHAFPQPYPFEEVMKESSEHTAKKLKNSKFFRDDLVTIHMDPTYVEKKQSPEVGGTTLTEYLIKNDNGDVIGSLVHSRPNDAMQKSQNGANNLFKEIQAEDIGLRRNAARNSGSSMETMTRHFVGNWGFPYEFGVNVPTKPFQGAPVPVLKAMAQLTYYGQQAVESSKKSVNQSGHDRVDGSTLMDAWVPYNELLVLGYMEEDFIGYHDDGEAQLSGTITTICLGSPAELHLRMKGGKKNTNNDSKKSSKVGKKAGKNPPILKVQLLHGDSVTMCDTKLQKFTDHTVIPEGTRRFALTGRAINPSYYNSSKNLKKLDKLFGLTAEGAKSAAELPANAADFTYPDLPKE